MSRNTQPHLKPRQGSRKWSEEITGISPSMVRQMLAASLRKRRDNFRYSVLNKERARIEALYVVKFCYYIGALRAGEAARLRYWIERWF